MKSKKVIPIQRGGAPASSPSRTPSKAEVALLIEKAREIAAKSPEKAAIILTAWIQEVTQEVTQEATKRLAQPKKKTG